MSPKQFLQIGGAILVVVGVLGYIGVLGPTASQSLFGATWWFDNAENISHLVLGIVGLGLAFWGSAQLQKGVTLLLGVVGVLVGLYSLVSTTPLLGANLENPADTVLHIVVGAWALWAGTKKQA